MESLVDYDEDLEFFWAKWKPLAVLQHDPVIFYKEELWFVCGERAVKQEWKEEYRSKPFQMVFAKGDGVLD